MVAVMISVPFQVFQLLISLVILNNQKSPYLYLLAPQNIVTLPFITYLLGSLVLLLSVIIKDKRWQSIFLFLFADFRWHSRKCLYFIQCTVFFSKDFTLFSVFNKL